MSVTIRLPEEFARYAGGVSEHQAPVGTVDRAIEHLCEQFPELRVRLKNERGQIFPYLALLLNDCRLPLLAAQDASVNVGDTLEIMTLASGG